MAERASADLATAMHELGPDEAAKAARTVIDGALEQFTPTEREQFWNAIGLYYSTRRHPGQDESKDVGGNGSSG